MSKFSLSLFALLFTSLMLVSGCSKDDSNPAAPQNNAPVIQSVTANPNSVNINQTTTLSCTATDPDNNSLTYTWSSANGGFPGGTNGTNVQWQAPATAGNYIVTVTVSDGDLTDLGTVTVVVEPPDAFLEAVTVVSIPFTDAGGTGWDVFPPTGPDLQWNLTDASGNIILSSSTAQDITPQDLPITWRPNDPYQFQSWSQTLYIRLYDIDPLGSESIGAVFFSINGIVNQRGYVSTYTLTSGAIEVTLGLQWE